MINIPNFLTSFRVIGATLIPLIILIDSKEMGCFFVLIIFVLCSVTDFLDGFIARKFDQTSELGKMLDPIADKLLVILILCFFTLVFSNKYGFLLGIPSILIITREILVSGIREFFGSKNNIFDVLVLSKYKTAFQMLAIIVLLLSIQDIMYKEFFYYLGIFLLWISALISIYTAIVYFKKSLTILRD